MLIKTIYKMFKAFLNGEDYDGRVEISWLEIGAILLIVVLITYLAVR